MRVTVVETIPMKDSRPSVSVMDNLFMKKCTEIAYCFLTSIFLAWQRLDEGGLIYARFDNDMCIRRHSGSSDTEKDEQIPQANKR